MRLLVSLQSGVQVEPGSGDGSVDDPWILTMPAPELVTISQDTTIDYSTISQYEGKDIKITNNATVTIVGGGQDINSNITIESGNLMINNSFLNGKITNNGGTVTLESCTINNTVQCNSGRIDLYYCTLNGTLDKNGGSIYEDGEPI